MKNEFRFYFLLLIVFVSCSKQEEVVTNQKNTISNQEITDTRFSESNVDESGSRSNSIDVVLIFGGSNSLGVDQQASPSTNPNPDVEYSYLYLKTANSVLNSTSRYEATNKVAYNQPLQTIEFTNNNGVTKDYNGIEFRLAHHWKNSLDRKLAIVKVSSFRSGIRNAFDPNKVNHFRYLRGFVKQVMNKLGADGYQPTLRLVVHVSSASDMNDILDPANEQKYRDGLNRFINGIEARWGSQTKFVVTKMGYDSNQTIRKLERAKLHQIINSMAYSRSNLYFANANDLDLIQNDPVHITFSSQNRLGNRIYHVSKPFP